LKERLSRLNPTDTQITPIRLKWEAGFSLEQYNVDLREKKREIEE
jgi:hypothetical protein